MFSDVLPAKTAHGTMNKRMVAVCAIAMTLLGLTGCAEPVNDNRRWYSEDHTERGRALYAAHCMDCHGADGAGTVNWRQTGPDGTYPPPPLNGTAHTWHHPLRALDRTIAHGGQALGGVMPGFSAVLDRQERLAIIAYIQSLWPDAVYDQWVERSRAMGEEVEP